MHCIGEVALGKSAAASRRHPSGSDLVASRCDCIRTPNKRCGSNSRTSDSKRTPISDGDSRSTASPGAAISKACSCVIERFIGG